MAGDRKIIKCVAFDLDGTLIDSVGWFRDFYCEIVHKYGGPKEYDTQKTFEEFAKSYYKGDELIFVAYKRFLIERFALKGCSAEEMYEQSARMCKERYAIYPFRPGANELIAKLKSEGKKLAIVTSAETKDLEVLAKNPYIDLKQFDTIICSNDVKNKKPSAEPYLLAAKRLQIEPHEMAVFEDSINGAESAINAGVGLLVVFNDKHSAHERENLQKLTSYSIDSFYDLQIGLFQ